MRTVRKEIDGSTLSQMCTGDTSAQSGGITNGSFLILHCSRSTVRVSCPIPLLSFISFTIRIRYFDFYGARLSEKDMPRIAARLNMEKYVPRDVMSLCDTGVEKAL